MTERMDPYISITILSHLNNKYRNFMLSTSDYIIIYGVVTDNQISNYERTKKSMHDYNQPVYRLSRRECRLQLVLQEPSGGNPKLSLQIFS